jgi:CBS domain-containing protein
MLVRDVMTTSVVSVTAGTTVREALRLLDLHSITCLPVVDADGRLEGVVSEADLLRESLPEDARTRMMPVDVPRSAPASTVGDVMTTHPVTLSPGDDLAIAVDLLTSTAVKSAPVVERGAVAGVISRRDVVHLLARDDERIQEEVSSLFQADDTDWLAEVEDGVVTVTGPATDAERRVADVLATSVSGVVAVRHRRQER